MLIAAGHPPSQLRHYTARQVQLFYAEAERARCHARADLIDDLRLAYAGKKHEVSRVIGALRKT